MRAGIVAEPVCSQGGGRGGRRQGATTCMPASAHHLLCARPCAAEARQRATQLRPPPPFRPPASHPPAPLAGTGEVVATVDADLAAFYRGLTPQQLERTAVITVADHGATMGLNYMYTQHGRVRGSGGG